MRWRTLRLGYGLLVIASTSWGRPAPAQEPSKPAQLVEQPEQSTVGALDARRSSAEARSAAAESYFDGEGDWEQAFPDYVDISFGDAGALATSREILHRRALARAMERVADPPAALSTSDARRWSAARDAAVEAEEWADAAEARFVAGLEAALERAPALSDLSIDRRFRELSDCMAVPAAADTARKELAVACGTEDRALRRWRRAAWTAVTKPGDTTLSSLVADALSTPPVRDAPADVRLRGTLDRLIRVRPLLTARTSDVDAWIDAADELLHGEALATFEETKAAPVAARTVPEIESDLAALRARLDEERKAAEPIATDPASTARAVRLATGRVDRIERSIAALERELAALSGDVVASEPTGPSVDEERQSKAEDAARRAADARTPAEAAVLAATAAIRKQTVEVVEAESARRASALSQMAEWRRELDAGEAALAAGLARASLDPERQPSIDAAYVRIRDLTNVLNDAAAESDRALAEARREATNVTVAESATAVDAKTLLERDDAVADLRAVLRARSLTLESERNALVDLLVECKHARRAAREHASDVATAAGRQRYLPALAAEVRDIDLVAAGRLGATLTSLRGMPRALTDITFIGAVLRSSLLFLLMLVAWRFLRGGTERWIRGIVDRVVAANPRDETGWAAIARLVQNRLEPGDLRLLVEPWSRVVRGLLDAAAAAVIAEYLGSWRPLLGLIAWIWFAVVIWRIAPRLLDLLFATAGEGRPSIRRVEAATRARLFRAVRLVLAWQLTTLLLDQALLEVLAADKLTQLVDAVSAVAGVLLALFLVYDWAEPIRSATAAAEQTRVARWAATAGSPLMVLPRAVVGATVLAGAWVEGLFTDVARSSSRTDVRWLGALLARRQLGAEADVDGPPLDGTVRERLSALEHGTPRNVEAAITRLLAIHGEWSLVRRRGLVAVIGDRGSGVEQIGDRIAERLTTPTVLRVPRRFGRPEEAIGWLAEALGRSGSDPVELAHSLASERGRVVVLLDTHRLFLRTVGGFAVLRAIFDVLQATSEEMFWVVVMNAPTWRFLQGTPGAVDVGVFRPAVDVGGLTDRDLAAWLLEPARAAGLDPSFRSLCRAPDPERADPRSIERATRLYFRLLADASQGRPAAARLLWLSSLRGGAAPDRIEHAVPASASAREIDALRDEDLFLCTSLALHGQLDIQTLTVVLNRDPGAIRSACRRLESFGILRGDENGEWFDLDDTLHPLVLRVLRHRAFLGAAA
jgi:hypothetical protein